eukprot:2100454-Pleurochrysis_carterae.AAC.1
MFNAPDSQPCTHMHMHARAHARMHVRGRAHAHARARDAHRRVASSWRKGAARTADEDADGGGEPDRGGGGQSVHLTTRADWDGAGPFPCGRLPHHHPNALSQARAMPTLEGRREGCKAPLARRVSGDASAQRNKNPGKEGMESKPERESER